MFSEPGSQFGWKSSVRHGLLSHSYLRLARVMMVGLGANLALNTRIGPTGATRGVAASIDIVQRPVRADWTR